MLTHVIYNVIILGLIVVIVKLQQSKPENVINGILNTKFENFRRNSEEIRSAIIKFIVEENLTEDEFNILDAQWETLNCGRGLPLYSKISSFKNCLYV